MLAAEAPELRQALDRAKGAGFSHVILDGTIITCDRCKEPAQRQGRGHRSAVLHGGARLDLSLAAAIPAVQADLARIDTKWVTTDPVLAAILGLVFEHTAALTRSAGIARRLTQAGLLSPTPAPRPRCCWPARSTRP